MDIFIDDGVSRDWFFISVPINDKDSISFDWTVKGQRVVLQRLEGKVVPPNLEPSAEWDTIHIRNGKLIEREHVKWYDQGEKDVINDEIYKTIKEWPVDKMVASRLLDYSVFVREHSRELYKYADKMSEFEKFLEKLLMEYKDKFLCPQE